MAGPLQTIQSEEYVINGSPEGVVKAQPGFEVIDAVTGYHYIKSTRANVNTGWKRVLLDGDVVSGSPRTFLWNQTDGKWYELQCHTVGGIIVPLMSQTGINEEDLP